MVRDLREETMLLPQAIMATSLDQQPILRMFASLSGAKCIVDVGTFTGISALQFALVHHTDHYRSIDRRCVYLGGTGWWTCDYG